MILLRPCRFSQCSEIVGFFNSIKFAHQLGVFSVAFLDAMLWLEVQDGLNYSVWHLRDQTLIVVNEGDHVYKISSCLSTSDSCVYFAHCSDDQCMTWGKIEAGAFVLINPFHTCRGYRGYVFSGIVRRRGRLIEE